jgi:hypothetical protein
MLTVATEDTTSPKANLLDKRAAKVYASTSTTALQIDIDFTAAVSLDAIALINHNWTNAATITITSGAAFPPGDAVDTPAWRQYDIKSTFTSQSKRYWRVVVADSNTDNLYLGRIVPGIKTDFPRRFSHAQNKSINHNDINLQTIRGVPYNYNLFDVRGKEYTFTPLTETEADEFDVLDIAVNGRQLPFVLFPDVDTTEVLYGFKQVEHVLQGSDNSFMTYRLVFMEDTRGEAIAA